MLPEQSSITNPAASINFLADSTLSDFFTHGSFDLECQMQQIEQNKVDNIFTNQESQQEQQLVKREAQQHFPTARPGPTPHQSQCHDDGVASKALQPAPEAGIFLKSLQVHNIAPEQRPCTPPNQIEICQFPITPDKSPQETRAVTKDILKSRTVDSSPTRGLKKNADFSACVNPAETMRRTSSYPDSSDRSGKDVQCNFRSKVPSPPPSAGLIPPASFGFGSSDFLDMSTLNMNFVPKDSVCNTSHYSPLSTALSPLVSSFDSSPEMGNLSLFENTSGLHDFSLTSQSSNLSISHSPFNPGPYPTPPKEKSHRRTQSVATVDLDGTNEETGITDEEISAYIVGPLQDNKYMCTYDNCGKLFGRKENIRSHVQTHLGDRQWRCNHCHKRFVRQHDLKRHAKIHTGQKPHMCPCGNGFARHDALTRHRQRNTCIGGFGVAEGAPPSPSKRGRPKKRPDLGERMDKAAKTRQRILEKASTSSVSGSSDYSAASPEMFFEEIKAEPAISHSMVAIQSQESDNTFGDMATLSPAMVDECLQELSKSSSPFSDFDPDKVFGLERNAFDACSTMQDPTWAWLYE